MEIWLTFVVTIINDEFDSNLAANDLSLREAIEQANLTGAPDQITFDAGFSGSTLRLTQGELQITRAVTIDGDLDNAAIVAQLTAVNTRSLWDGGVEDAGSAGVSNIDFAYGVVGTGAMTDDVKA